MLAKRVLRGACGWIIRLMLLIVPARRRVFVTAFPSDEGNLVEVVRLLARRYPGDLVWADAPSETRLHDFGIDPNRVLRKPKRSVAAVWAFLTAEAVFVTHEVYGRPRPVSGKVIINVWHGDGPKANAGEPIPASYLVSGSRILGEHRAQHLQVHPDNLLLTGNPRIQQLGRPASPAQLHALGVDPDRPFVVWLPTWRQNSGHHSFPSPPETTDVTADHALAHGFAAGASALGDLGIQVVVKPHPLDRVSRFVPGALMISEEALEQAGTSLYCLLGRSAGLLTDYSSVWTDYLVLDRPIAFFMPDLDAYASVRRMHPPDWLHHLPGRQLIDIDDFTTFGREISGGGDDSGRLLRQHAREHFQLIHPPEAAEDLLHELEQRGVLTLVHEPGSSATGSMKNRDGARLRRPRRPHCGRNPIKLARS